MKCFDSLLIAALTLVISTNNAGAAERFNLDKDHTTISFNVGYLVLGRVNGQFDDFKGSFVVDSIHPEQNRANIIIQTASVNTGIKAWDKDIRGPYLFNTSVYPTMAFHSRQIEVGADNTGQIVGDLTLLGITKPITLDLIKGPEEDKKIGNGFKVTGQIKRSDFGMNAFLSPVANTVTLLICYNMVTCEDQTKAQRTVKPRYNE